ncbi:cysteine hydrolase family protein [Oribacterium sp. WCC10]|uniref:cysteine hydrolase family protein n=1 Tax=Oribacterium sp. WCC10 TaxID=1855343 RepID=UPI0008DFF78D|nr:isochorismatase family protein [Oribacterium sp. WCC10]SFG15574.1 Nicotinamidase-related amidase [Oribacterium sp. WCC10]
MQKDDLILVIDMQKVYLEGNPWACKNIKSASGKIAGLLDRIIELKESAESGNSGSKVWISNVSGNINVISGTDNTVKDQESMVEKTPDVMLTRFIAASDEDTVGTWTEYNEVNRDINDNPVMNEFIPEIARYVEDFPYFDKCTYSCFSHPYVRAAGDKAMLHGGSIVLTGVVAECCVLSTFFQGVDLGYHFIYLTDACAGLDDETENAVKKVLEGLSPLHVEMMTTEEYFTYKRDVNTRFR